MERKGKFWRAKCKHEDNLGKPKERKAKYYDGVLAQMAGKVR
jgi:hypothetical protein